MVGGNAGEGKRDLISCSDVGHGAHVHVYIRMHVHGYRACARAAHQREFSGASASSPTSNTCIWQLIRLHHNYQAHIIPHVISF